MSFSVRRFMAPLPTAILLVSVACAPAAPPPPTAAPPKPAATAAPAQPAATQAPAAANPTTAPAAPAKPTAAAAQPTSASAGQAPELKNLKVGIIPVAALTPPIVANKLGYFKDEGFENVEFTTLGGGAELLPAVEAGKLDLALSAYFSVFQAREQGFDFWIVCNNDSATDGPKDGFGVTVLNDSTIQSVKDLEGKKVATNTNPSISIAYIAAGMKKVGADYKKVNWVEMGFPQMPDALFNKQVDAIAAIEPSHTVAATSGKARDIAYPYVEATPGIDLGGFIATGNWVKQNPITAQKFTRALARAQAYMSQNKDTAIKEIVDFSKLNTDVVQKMYMPVWRTKPDPARVQSMADLMLDTGMLKQKIDVKQFMAPSALQ